VQAEWREFFRVCSSAFGGIIRDGKRGIHDPVVGVVVSDELVRIGWERGVLLVKYRVQRGPERSGQCEEVS
jgi:hypothetical protein